MFQELNIANGTRHFNDIVHSPFFIDKTLLIRDFLQEHFSSNNPPVVSVLTPPRFGKTTNNDMIKKYLEMSVDGKGELQEVELTRNYKLFKENNLNIFKDDLFLKHFGKYPVISINCKPLSEAVNFDHMIQIFREILKSTFSEHRYLLSVEELWQNQFNKTTFELYFDEKNVDRLHKYYIFCGFSILSEVLHVHFGKPVFVLIDDFDAFEDCPAYVTGEDKRRIFNFVKEVHGDLLVDNEHLAAGLLVGSVREEKKGKDKTKWALNAIEISPTLWKYYGLSEEELKLILNRFIENEEERKILAEAMVKQSNNSTIKGCNGRIKHQICSIISVEQYFVRHGIRGTLL